MTTKKIVLIHLFIATFLSVFILGFLWISAELNFLKSEKKLIAENSILEQKEELKKEVDKVINFIEFKNRYSNTTPDSLIKNEVLEYLAGIRFGKDGYIFVNTFEGNALIFDGKLVQGKKDISEMKDQNGLNIFQLELMAAQNLEGDFIEYMFKTMNDSMAYAKISYINKYEKWQWIVGAGDYYININDVIKSKIKYIEQSTMSQIVKALIAIAFILLFIIFQGIWITNKIREQYEVFSKYVKCDEKEKGKLFQDLKIDEYKDIGFDLRTANSKSKEFANIIDQSLNEIYIFDAETLKFLYANNSAQKNIGYSGKELLMLSPLDLKPEFTKEQFAKLLKSVDTGEKANVIFETVYKRKDKSIYPVEVHLQKTVFNDEEAFVSIIWDISIKKEFIETLIKKKSEIESIFRAAPVGIGYVINRKILKVNERFSQMLGYGEDELLGKDAIIVYPSKEDYEFVGKEKYRQISEKGTGTVETKLKKKNGEIINVILSSTPMDLTDLSKGVTFTALDITNRVKIETELNESEERFRNIFESSNAVMYLIDPDNGKFLDVNPAAIKFYGYSYKQFVDELFIQQINILSKNEIKKEMDLVRKDKKGYFNFKHKLNNGEIRDVEVYGKKIGLKEEEVLFSIVHDITDRKKTETELAKYQNNLETLVEERTSELEKKNKELEKFNDLFVNREFRIKELKDEIQFLKDKLK